MQWGTHRCAYESRRVAIAVIVIAVTNLDAIISCIWH